MESAVNKYKINLSDVLIDLDQAFNQYENALIQNNVPVLDKFFWDNPDTIRYGIAENLYGADEIRAYRKNCDPVPPGRKITQKRIKLAEVSLGDFEGRLENELLNWFSLTPQHWIMLHMVMLAYYKNKSITKNELLKVIEKSYLTSNVYIDTAIKKGFFRIIRNEKDKRSIFILPSVITIKTFEGFIDRRDIVYKGI